MVGPGPRRTIPLRGGLGPARAVRLLCMVGSWLGPARAVRLLCMVGSWLGPARAVRLLCILGWARPAPCDSFAWWVGPGPRRTTPLHGGLGPRRATPLRGGLGPARAVRLLCVAVQYRDTSLYNPPQCSCRCYNRHFFLPLRSPEGIRGDPFGVKSCSPVVRTKLLGICGVCPHNETAVPNKRVHEMVVSRRCRLSEFYLGVLASSKKGC